MEAGAGGQHKVGAELNKGAELEGRELGARSETRPAKWRGLPWGDSLHLRAVPSASL